MSESIFQLQYTTQPLVYFEFRLVKAQQHFYTKALLRTRVVTLQAMLYPNVDETVTGMGIGVADRSGRPTARRHYERPVSAVKQ